MFKVTEELIQIIAQHDKFVEAARSGLMLEEPANPWPQIIEDMLAQAEGITLGWGSMEEVAVDFLEAKDNNTFFDNTMHRYHLGALDTQELVELWEEFKPLRNYMAM